ncbi:MAG: peptidoglycan DD-metalloendopeptidase family protein [Methylococcales bacterium]|nr:peptidoglycan DD-metalloendopeptidase family protein [Methylococcales bacterium]
MRFFLMVAFIFVSSQSLSWAENALENRQQLNEVRTDINDVHQSMEKIDDKRDDVSKQLRDIEKEYGKVANSLRSLSSNINTKWRRLKEIRRDIKFRQITLKKESHELEGQIKATFIMGQKEKLKLLLNQQDSKLASRMLMYYRYLNEARLRRVVAIKEHIAVLTELQQEKSGQSKQLKENSSFKKQQQQRLIKTRNKRKVLLVKLNKDFTLKTQQLNHLKSNEKELEALITSLSASQGDLSLTSNFTKIKTVSKKTAKISLKDSFKKYQGTLAWPLKGKILKQFDSERNDGRWDGVLISATEGSDIQAIAKGKIIYADWLRGYGLLVIIDHHSGYMSLYAFNQSLSRKVGDTVKAGTIIAAAGKSGGRKEIGLYFGIRYKGKSVNPAHWCRKIQNGYAG